MTTDLKPRPFRPADGGVRLVVRVTPRAKTHSLGGLFVGPDDKIAQEVRLAAPPVDGAANKALVAFLAKALRLGRSAISIESGEKSRFKTVFLAGETDRLIDNLAEWLGDQG